MHMYFVFSENVTLLFDFWTVQTAAVWKSNLLTRVLLTLPLTPDPVPSLSVTSDPLLDTDPSPDGESLVFPVVGHIPSVYRWWLLHSSVALLHVAQVVLGYALMLCVMSYNASLFLAVILGSALGYFLAFPLLAQYPPAR
ncbi:protein SLC31A2 isoform X2 [Ascaphus truei]|uniref:protein SLC31A2 isoform X2 n=1 Tax=Ascaphus truei TaxID=8439 RepID=UPI003F59C38F